MSKGKMLTREAVLKMAKDRPLVVHRFSWGESAVRTLTMRMFSQGLYIKHLLLRSE